MVVCDVAYHADDGLLISLDKCSETGAVACDDASDDADLFVHSEVRAAGVCCSAGNNVLLYVDVIQLMRVDGSIGFLGCGSSMRCNSL